MQSEIRSEFRQAQTEKDRNSGFGFGLLDELKEKCLAVKRKILRKDDYVQTPEITKEVNEVLLLAEENDPNFRGSRRKKANYSLLLEYRHCWTRYDRMEDCPLSKNALFLLNSLATLRNAPSEQKVNNTLSTVKEIDSFFKDFLEGKFFGLIKQAKRKGLTAHAEFSAGISQARKNPTLIPSLIFTWLGKCPVANYMVNLAVETLLKNRKSFDVFHEGQAIGICSLAMYWDYVWQGYQRDKKEELDIKPAKRRLDVVSDLLESLNMEEVLSRFTSSSPPRSQPA